MAHVRVRAASPADVEDVLDLAADVFGADAMTRWRAHHLRAHLDRFPEGQLVVRADGELVASSASLLASREAAMGPHTWTSLTGGNELPNHDPEGTVLYGLEIAVHPDHRGRGIARRLYEARKDLVRERGLEALVVVGRVPGFAEAHGATGVSIDDYVAQVLAGQRRDPVLGMQLAVGLEPAGVLENYVLDPASLHHGVRLTWQPDA